ncbi:MAG: DJ-1/PfpI family protein [Muribaculaceae bacterium]|nr:DJ-1/PfpI family protein [Muribaculaceae bacterium]
MKESFVFLADGFEDIEALTVVDVMRRAGMPVKTVSITSSLQVRSAHGVIVTADVLYDNTLFDDPDWLVLPGGMPGATNLYEFAPLAGLLARHAESENGRIAAICAAPAVVLGQLGMLKGEKATCYPGFEQMLNGAEYQDSPVVVSGKFVLGNGPANALAWSYTIVAQALGESEAERVANGMLYYPNSTERLDYKFG